jgi:hypothetical protein
LPGWYYALSGASNAVALWKKPVLPTLPKGIRPLGLGDVTQRAWESRFVACETSLVANLFWEAGQVSIGCSAGCEKLAFAHRFHLEHYHSITPVDAPILEVHVTFSPDCKNAFPTTSRAQAIGECAAHPSLHKLGALLNASLKPQSVVANVSGAVIGSGFKQGAPPASIGHCAATLPHCQRANTDLRAAGGMANFITDDGVFTGPLGAVLRVWAVYKAGIKKHCGLDTNIPKCVLFGPGDRMDEIRLLLDSNPVWKDVRFDSVLVDGEPKYGITLGGVPIGHDDYVKSAMERKLRKSASNFTKIITKLKDIAPQAAYAVATQHFSAEWVFTLRTVYPTLSVPFARRMDTIMADGLLQLTHTVIPPGSIASERVALPRSSGGHCMRKLEDLAAPAFIGAVCQCVPSFGPIPTANGEIASGILRHLPALFGATSFVKGNEATRFATILAGGSRLGSEMESAWDLMVNELPTAWRLAPEHTDKLLSQPAVAMGTVNGAAFVKVQRLLTQERESYRISAMQSRISTVLANQEAFVEAQLAIVSGAALSPAAQLVEQAIAARSSDKYNSAFVQALPTKGKLIRPELWRLMHARRLGLPCPECAPHRNVVCGRTMILHDVNASTGERTQRPGSGLPIRVGFYGHGLHIGNRKALGGFHTARHDSCVWVLCQEAWHCGVLLRREPSDLWQHLITNIHAHNNAPKHVRSASVPDFEEDRGGGVIKLADAKCWSRCNTWFQWSWFQHGRVPPTARKRQQAGSKVMIRRCDKADELWNPMQPRNPHGPIGSAARAYGRIEILGCGPYGEATPDTDDFVKRIATKAADDGWREMGARNAAEASGTLTHSIRQRVGVAFARTTAELTMRRLRAELNTTRTSQRSQTRRRDAARRASAAASDAYDARQREPD